MSHLDDLAAALVDQELSHDQRDRAFAHLAGCDGCRAEVEQQRRLKTRLAIAAVPAPPVDLEIRLLALPGELRVDVTRRLPAPASGRPATARSAARPAAGRPAARPVARRRRGRIAVGSVSALAVACGVVVLLGSGDTGAPAVRPPVSTFVEEHTATTGNLPFEDPGAGVVLISFAE